MNFKLDRLEIKPSYVLVILSYIYKLWIELSVGLTEFIKALSMVFGLTKPPQISALTKTPLLSQEIYSLRKGRQVNKKY